MPYSIKKYLFDLWRWLRPYKGRFFVASLLRLICDLTWLYPPYALAEAVTLLTKWQAGDSPRPFLILLIGMVIAILVRRLGQFTMRMIGNKVAEGAALDARVAGLKHLCQLDLSWHEQENAGNKVKRIDSGAESINSITRIWFNMVIEIVVSLVAVIIILIQFDAWVAVCTGIFLVFYFTLSSHLSRRAGVAARHVNAKQEEFHGLLFESVNNIRTVKVLAMTPTIMRQLQAVADELLQRISKRVMRFQIRDLSVSIFSEGFRLGMVTWIVIGIVNGRYEVGFLLIFYGYFARVLESVGELAGTVVEDFILAKYSMHRMMQIYDTPVYQDGKDAKKLMPKNWKTISLRNVSFAYGNDQVLKNVSFDIRRGERVGIVGLSGAGKSTLFKLLLKENENYSGEILVDDMPLRKIKKTSYYEQTTVVLQETEVFNLSLRDNVTIANHDRANDDRALKKALDIAHVSAFLPRLPQGVDTAIGEKGIKLSGGERQRVGIARAVFKQPELLFLDEATSHLDLESEKMIRDSLHVFFKQVTAVVIAHRLTTIKEMDRILVLEGGKLIEQGSFDYLYEQRGRFYELWELQKLNAV